MTHEVQAQLCRSMTPCRVQNPSGGAGSGLSAAFIGVSRRQVYASTFADLIETGPAAGFLSKSALTGAAIRNLVGDSASVEKGDHR
jgi:hypothetical protein